MDTRTHTPQAGLWPLAVCVWPPGSALCSLPQEQGCERGGPPRVSLELLTSRHRRAEFRRVVATCTCTRVCTVSLHVCTNVHVRVCVEWGLRRTHVQK